MRPASLMTTVEILAEFNALTGKSTKKFASRAQGERQLIAARKNQPSDTTNMDNQLLIHSYGTANCPSCGIGLDNGVSQHGDDVNGKPLKHATHEYSCMACGHEFGPELKSKKQAFSDAVSESWNDPEVAAKRAQRNKVSVNGQIFRSVSDAFKFLGLPYAKHIKFRMSLKKHGVLDSGPYTFKIIA